MNQMMGNMGGMFGHDPFAMTPFGMRPPNRSLATPFAAFPSMMPSLQAMSNMGNMTNNPGSIVSSQFISYSSDGVNPPQVVERTHLNRVGHGGVREERRTLRDSRSGVQQMSIGRHINDRGHVMEKNKNHYTGEEEENNEFINIEEEEAPQFNNEWSMRMERPFNGNSSQRFIQAPPRRSEPVLAITGPDAPVISHHSHSSVPSMSDSRNKRLRTKPMKKEKKSKAKPYHKE